MLKLAFDSTAGPRRVLALGSHADDLEIGCGGTVLRLLDSQPAVEVRWVVLSAVGDRAREARASATALLAGAASAEIVVEEFRDGFFPACGLEIKEFFEDLKATYSPDLVFTHYRHDLHQDHRLVSELTWNTFRDHLILEYEVPKYDGDLGSPNVFVHLSEATCRRKVEILMREFASQADRRWFTADLFLSLLRLRGMEANSPSRYAEAFYGRKVVM